MRYQSFIYKLLQQTSSLSRKMYGKVAAKTKKSDVRQVLTAADIAVGKLIVRNIQKTFPDHNIIDEEAGVIDKGSQWTWVIDPIDGTANYAQEMPEYGNMIGLLKGDAPFAGGVSLPYFKKIYVAEKGRGAFAGKKRMRLPFFKKFTSKIVAFDLSEEPSQPWILTTGVKLFSKILKNFPICNDSGSVYDAIMVLEGRYLADVSFSGKIWDSVAQQIILEEAGAVYTDWQGKPVDYSNPMTKTELNYTWCTAGMTIHKKIQRIVRSL